MLFKIIFITIFIPSIINLLLSLSLFEKEKPNIVHESKFLYLYLPSFGSIFLCLGAYYNLKSFVHNGCIEKDEFIFASMLFACSIFALIVVIMYKCTIIRYDDKKLLYRRKWYNYNQIYSLGNTKNKYVFVLKNGKKIKFSISAVGSNELCKTYLNYKKKQNKTGHASMNDEENT